MIAIVRFPEPLASNVEQRWHIIGRFTRIDPWEGDPPNPITLNKYLYANGNPLVYVDPDGRQSCDWCIAYGYAETDEQRQEVLRYAANQNPTTGRIAGAALPVVRTAAEIRSAINDLGSADPAAQQRTAARVEGLQAAQREWAPYMLSGAGGIARKWIKDLGTSIGTHADELSEVITHRDYVGQGEAGMGLAADASEVLGASAMIRGSVRQMLRSTTLSPSAATNRVVQQSRAVVTAGAGGGEVVGVADVHTIENPLLGMTPEEVVQHVKALGLTTERDDLLLWSGLGRGREGVIRSQEYAAKFGGKTLEMTRGGRWLDEMDLYGSKSPFTRLEADQIWIEVSRTIAQQASGQVRVLTGSVRPTSVYRTIEQPELMDNPNVTGVDEVNLKSRYFGSR